MHSARDISVRIREVAEQAQLLGLCGITAEKHMSIP